MYTALAKKKQILAHCCFAEVVFEADKRRRKREKKRATGYKPRRGTRLTSLSKKKQKTEKGK